MFHKKKTKNPFYNQFLSFRKNIINSPKFLKFKKKKWARFKALDSKRFKFYSKYKLTDQLIHFLPRFASRGNSAQRRYWAFKIEQRAFSVFYGGFQKKQIKNCFERYKRRIDHVKGRTKDKEIIAFEVFERRLDSLLNRIYFSYSPKNARQLIAHGHILVNGHKATRFDHLVRAGDTVEVKPCTLSMGLIRNNLTKAMLWPIPPKHLFVNYRTLTVVVAHQDYKENRHPVIHRISINFSRVFNAVRFLK